jgi:ketosteroid isomerase-like protein
MLTPKEVVQKFVKVWAAGDLAATMSLVAEDARYTLHLSDELIFIGGETVGRDNIEQALRQVRREFDYLVFRPMTIVARGDVVRLRMEFMYRHMASGQILSGRFRLIIGVKDGLIFKADEYHDRPMVEAFLRLYVAPTQPEADSEN